MASKTRVRKQAETNGNGEATARFVVASHTRKGGDLSTLILSHQNTEIGSLVIRPWQPQVVDRRWLDHPEFSMLVDEGLVEVSYSDTAPARETKGISPEFEAMLDEHGRTTIMTICELPMTIQHEGIIRLDRLVSDNGLPTNAGSRVTKDYLKSRHLVFLRALIDLESRWQNRQDVIRMAKDGVRRIEAL